MKQYNQNIKTFTIGFENDNNTSELTNAKKIANYYDVENYGTVHNIDQIIKSIPNMINHLEEPIADATSVSTYLLSKFASNKVKTVLSGEGADELYRGYVYYKNMDYYKRFNDLPNIVKKPSTQILSKVSENSLSKLFNYPNSIGEVGKKRLIKLLHDKKDEFTAYDSFISLFTNKELINLKIKTNLNKKTSKSIYQHMFYRDVKTWLPDYILTRVDKMSMANSLECRTPFLDHRIVEHASSLSFDHKFNNKYSLRKAMKNYLPNYKQKKYPFFIPIDEYYDKGLKEYYESLFEDSILIQNKIINKILISDLIKNHNKSNLINSRKLWSLMTLELCYKQFVL